MPIPRPETFVTCSEVVNPGRKISSSASRSLMRRASCGVTARVATARASSASARIPSPSSVTSMPTCPPSCHARTVSTPSSGLPAARRASGSSMPWSTALRTRWVSGSFTASTIERSSSVSPPPVSIRTCLPQRQRQVAHDARELRPRGRDRLHPGLHDAALELGGDQAHPLRRDVQVRRRALVHQLQQPVPGQHQLPDRGHQPVQERDVDAHRRVRVRLRERRRARRGDRLGLAGVPAGRAQPLQLVHQLVVVVVPVGAGGLDLGEHRAQRVPGREQRPGDGRRERQRPVAERRQQALGRVRHPLQLREAEEPAGPLDRVHRAEDPRQDLGGAGVALEREEVAVQPVEALHALDQELRDDLVHLVGWVRHLGSGHTSPALS